MQVSLVNHQCLDKHLHCSNFLDILHLATEERIEHMLYIIIQGYNITKRCWKGFL